MTMLLNIVAAAALILSLLLTTAAVTAAEIRADSILGRNLLAQATLTEAGTTTGRQLGNDNEDYSFVAGYSIKFLGCHHVQQWNDNADDEDDVKIMTKRLARFRLCPSDQCGTDSTVGCTSHFGDYVVDMDSFIESYLEAMENEKEEVCEDNDCIDSCNGDGDCLYECYLTNDMEFCIEDENNDDFDAQDYALCQQYDLPDNNNNRRRLEDGDDDEGYYIGAFCADQGGEIHLGLFTDDTCTTFASNGYSLFKNAMGYSMPYSETSLVSSRCLSCGYEENGYYQSKEICEDTYQMAGKCETRMDIDYPNESSCNYIEGIKIIREDGVIRTSSVKKSKAAAVAIGLFTTCSVLLLAYVYYLRTKLSRAQINLAASAQPLT